jgi:hypothetical protein
MFTMFNQLFNHYALPVKLQRALYKYLYMYIATLNENLTLNTLLYKMATMISSSLIVMIAVFPVIKGTY